LRPWWLPERKHAPDSPIAGSGVDENAFSCLAGAASDNSAPGQALKRRGHAHVTSIWAESTALRVTHKSFFSHPFFHVLPPPPLYFLGIHAVQRNASLFPHAAPHGVTLTLRLVALVGAFDATPPSTLFRLGRSSIRNMLLVG